MTNLKSLEKAKEESMTATENRSVGSSRGQSLHGATVRQKPIELTYFGTLESNQELTATRRVLNEGGGELSFSMRGLWCFASITATGGYGNHSPCSCSWCGLLGKGSVWTLLLNTVLECFNQFGSSLRPWCQDVSWFYPLGLNPFSKKRRSKTFKDLESPKPSGARVSGHSGSRWTERPGRKGTEEEDGGWKKALKD